MKNDFRYCKKYLTHNTNNYLITILISIICISGDLIVQHTNLQIFRALFDNATHAIIGGLSWLFVCLNFRKKTHWESLTEIAVCSAISSIIDLDHFVAAKSFNLYDATNLGNKRPILHCTTLSIAFCVFLLGIGYAMEMFFLKKVAIIFLTAFLSHHTRDATRRGFWLYPFGSTQPVPYFIYILLTCLIPYFICFLYDFFFNDNRNNVNLSVI